MVDVYGIDVLVVGFAGVSRPWGFLCLYSICNVPTLDRSILRSRQEIADFLRVLANGRPSRRGQVVESANW